MQALKEAQAEQGYSLVRHSNVDVTRDLVDPKHTVVSMALQPNPSIWKGDARDDTWTNNEFKMVSSLQMFCHCAVPRSWVDLRVTSGGVRWPWALGSIA